MKIEIATKFKETSDQFKQSKELEDRIKKILGLWLVDIIAILAQNNRPRKYWDDLKRKLKQEGSELSEKIGQLKLGAKDGKKVVSGGNYLKPQYNFKKLKDDKK